MVSVRSRLKRGQWHSHRSDGCEDRARPSDKREKGGHGDWEGGQRVEDAAGVLRELLEPAVTERIT
jgi:hypothetical protein